MSLCRLFVRCCFLSGYPLWHRCARSFQSACDVRSALYSLVRPPSIYDGSLPETTMASADFLVYRNTESNPRPPPVNALSYGQSLPDLHDKHYGFLLWDIDMLCYLILTCHASYPVPVRQYRLLQSRFLQCMDHSKPPCGLLIVQVVTPVYRETLFPWIINQHTHS